ncbi:NAD(P)-binding protein [Venturia nashicola]|nr:NAD(P)-binding protein [Venturia nashicola]
MTAERKQRGSLEPEQTGAKIDFSEKYDVSSLKNKTALITGGATGIGQGIAIALADAGVYVTIADINTTEAESTVRKITEAGHKAQFIHCDVCSWDALVSAFKSAIDFSPENTLDIVIPAAGISNHEIRNWLGGAKENENGDPEPLPLKVLDINLDAVFTSAHLAMHYFKKHPGPANSEKQIIFVASMGGYTSMTGVLDYCTSKWAVRGLFRALRGARGIMGEKGPTLRCNLIAPTYVKTPMTKSFWGYMEQIGLKMAEVSDCTDVLMRMAADENVIGRAAAIAGDKASFDLCDDAEGLDAGREVGLSVSENKFGYTGRARKVATPAAVVKQEVPMDEVTTDTA